MVCVEVVGTFGDVRSRKSRVPAVWCVWKEQFLEGTRYCGKDDLDIRRLDWRRTERFESMMFMFSCKHTGLLLYFALLKSYCVAVNLLMQENVQSSDDSSASSASYVVPACVYSGNALLSVREHTSSLIQSVLHIHTHVPQRWASFVTPAGMCGAHSGLGAPSLGSI